jgi:glutamine synthetase
MAINRLCSAGNPHKLVLCETFNPATQKPIPTNTRAVARQAFDNPKGKGTKPWCVLLIAALAPVC